MRFDEAEARFNRAFYTVSFYTIQSIARVALGLKTTGSEHIPDDGPGIVASNHRSGFDILALPLAVRKRHISMLARDDLYKNPILSYLFRHWEAVPIHRDPGEFNRDDLRRVYGRLEKNRLLGLFPEGTRGNRATRRADSAINLGEFRPGIAGFARRFNAPTIPAAISGLDHAFNLDHLRNVRGRVAIGEPLEPPRKNEQSQQIFMAELRHRIEQLYDQTLEM